jgi:hypothetical protein
MVEPANAWKNLLADRSLNVARAGIYERLMDAQERIARARYQHGIENGIIQAALDQADEELSEDDRREDLYLSSLRHYVRALGGQLEVRAVFGDEAVVVRREPEDVTATHEPALNG